MQPHSPDAIATALNRSASPCYREGVIFRYLSVIGDSPEAFVILIAAFATAMLVGLAFHEFSHAYVADGLGDPTPRSMGRLTLNPRAHLDPVGSALIFFIGFGWAKPVPINPFRTRNPKQALVLISAAGPASNLLIAGLAGIPIKMGLVPFWHPFVPPVFAGQFAELWTRSPQDMIGLFLGTVVFINVLLAIFNFLPIAPLDGFQAVVGLLPNDLSRQFASTAKWGPGILMVLILIPFIGDGSINPLFDLIDPPRRFLLNLFVGEASTFRVG